MRLIELRVHAPTRSVTGYRYFWTKRVRGFNPKQHCARSLNGTFVKYEPGESYAPPTNETVSIALADRDRFLYVCGVSERNVWALNFHAAMQPEENSSFDLEMLNGQRLFVQGARLLPIPALPSGFAGLPDSFTTCRNYQFGVEYFGHPEKTSCV